jgi:hypothetical protein
MSPHGDWYHETDEASEREGKEQVDTVEQVRMERNDFPESCRGACRQSVPSANPVRMMPCSPPKHPRVQCEASPLAPT